MKFRDRMDAGEQLAKALGKYRGKVPTSPRLRRPSAVVLALPRGGVVLGRVIADELEAPLDLVIVRKIGHPWSPEYAIGAVTETGEPIWNESEVALIDKSSAKQNLSELVAREREEAKRRRKVYLGGRMQMSIKGTIAILVDDGIATGLTFKKAIEEVRDREPKRLVAAVPVMPAESVPEFGKLVDELVVLDAPENYLGAVGAYYDRFEQVSDEEVVQLMKTDRH